MSIPADAMRAASRYALERMCQDAGYAGVLNMNCKHTGATCLNEHMDDDKQISARWVNGKCMSYDTSFAKWCEEGDLRVIEGEYGDGMPKCVQTNKYCTRMGQDWDGTGCKISGSQWVAEQVLGSTVTKGAKLAMENVQNLTGVDPMALAYLLPPPINLQIAVADMVMDPSKFFSGANPLAASVTGLGCKIGIGGCPSPSPERVKSAMLDFLKEQIAEVKKYAPVPDVAKVIAALASAEALRYHGRIRVDGTDVDWAAGLWGSQHSALLGKLVMEAEKTKGIVLKPLARAVASELGRILKNSQSRTVETVQARVETAQTRVVASSTGRK